MSKQNAKIDFTQEDENAIPVITTKIVKGMTKAVLVFVSPKVALSVVTSQNTAYNDILTTADYEGKAADLAAARVLLEESLRLNGIYVNGIANNDVPTLISSGYPLTKDASPQGELLPTKSVTVNAVIDTASFTYGCEVVENAAGYLFAITEATNMEKNPYLWRLVWSSKSTGVVDNCVSGVKYKFAMAGCGTSTTLNFTFCGYLLFAQGN